MVASRSSSCDGSPHRTNNKPGRAKYNRGQSVVSKASFGNPTMHQELKIMTNRQRIRRTLIGVFASACFVLGLWTYDALGYHFAAQFEADHADDPRAVLESWQAYRAWHPTRNWSRWTRANTEENRFLHLEREAHQQQASLLLAQLRQLAADSDADPETL